MSLKHQIVRRFSSLHLKFPLIFPITTLHFPSFSPLHLPFSLISSHFPSFPSHSLLLTIICVEQTTLHLSSVTPVSVRLNLAGKWAWKLVIPWRCLKGWRVCVQVTASSPQVHAEEARAWRGRGRFKRAFCRWFLPCPDTQPQVEEHSTREEEEEEEDNREEEEV